jgi:hypothetical protein
VDHDDRQVHRSPLGRRLARAALRTAVVYGLLVWVYLAVNSLTHPETLVMPLTHLLPWPLEGDTALASFVLSACAFAALRTGVAAVEEEDL